ncbi:unnamed protein product [Mucor hiemalis]
MEALKNAKHKLHTKYKVSIVRKENPNNSNILDKLNWVKSSVETRKIMSSSQLWDEEYVRSKSNDKDCIKYTYYTTYVHLLADHLFLNIKNLSVLLYLSGGES